MVAFFWKLFRSTTPDSLEVGPVRLLNTVCIGWPLHRTVFSETLPRRKQGKKGPRTVS